MSESAEGVSVTGTGRVPVRPDVLVARFGAEITAQSVQAALDRCSVAMTTMGGLLRGAGLADRDRQTTGAQLREAYDNNGNPRGWTAAQELTARFRQLASAGDLVSRAIEAGGDAARLYSLGFDVDDDTAAVIEARRRAFAEARAKAEQYATLAGRRLGNVLMIRENDGWTPPRPMGLRAMAAPHADMQMEQGELEVTTSVEVRWALVD